MFNLDQSIAEWRRQIVAAGIKSSDVLDELESHLREDVERRMRAGATAERAFRDAVIQVGTAEQLRTEFGKISKPQVTFGPRTVRLGCVGMAVFTLLTEGWYVMSSDINLTGRVVGLVLIAAIACYIGFLPKLNQLWPGVRGLELRNGMGMAASVVLLAWTGLLLLSLTKLTVFPSEAVILSMVCWALYVAAAVTAFVLGYGTEPEVANPWTPAVWQSFELAGAEAARFHHDFIGTEHVLLGLLGQENGTARKTLENLGVRREIVRAEIEKIVAAGPQSHPTRPAVYTPRAKKAFRVAIREAKTAHAVRARTEHILLGLLCQGGGVAAIVLEKLGVNAATVREQLQSNKNDVHE
jgi:hypothetical protein